jgi:hypothetical protein
MQTMDKLLWLPRASPRLSPIFSATLPPPPPPNPLEAYPGPGINLPSHPGTNSFQASANKESARPVKSMWAWIEQIAPPSCRCHTAVPCTTQWTGPTTAADVQFTSSTRSTKRVIYRVKRKSRSTLCDSPAEDQAQVQRVQKLKKEAARHRPVTRSQSRSAANLEEKKEIPGTRSKKKSAKKNHKSTGKKKKQVRWNLENNETYIVSRWMNKNVSLFFCSRSIFDLHHLVCVGIWRYGNIFSDIPSSRICSFTESQCQHRGD